MLKSPIVARINTLLAQKGIQKKDFFSACGITSATFSQWNTGEIKSPRKKSLKRVADFLGVSVEYLLYGDGEEKENAPDPKTEGVDDKIVQFIRSASAEELTEILRYIDFLESKRKKT